MSLGNMLPDVVLRRIGRLEWTKAARSAVVKHARRLQREIVTVRQAGYPVENLVVLITTDGVRGHLCPRAEAVEVLRLLPQSVEWVQKLSRPAALGRCYLLVMDDNDPGAIIEERRPDSLAAMPA